MIKNKVIKLVWVMHEALIIDQGVRERKKVEERRHKGFSKRFI